MENQDSEKKACEWILSPQSLPTPSLCCKYEDKTKPSEFCPPPKPATPENRMDFIRLSKAQNKVESDGHRFTGGHTRSVLSEPRTDISSVKQNQHEADRAGKSTNGLGDSHQPIRTTQACTPHLHKRT